MKIDFSISDFSVSAFSPSEYLWRMKPEVLLRDIEPDDLPIFFEHQRDPVAVAMVVFRSREKAEFDEHWAKILADDVSLKKTIVADGQVAGHIASFMRDGEREIGYWIERTLWGRGICQRSARCVSLPGTEAATLRRRGPTQYCLDTRPAKMWLHLMPERDRSGTRARRRVAYYFQACHVKASLTWRAFTWLPLFSAIRIPNSAFQISLSSSRAREPFRSLRFQRFVFQL